MEQDFSASTNRTGEAADLWERCYHVHLDLPKLTASFFSEYFRTHGRDLPWRKTRNPYFILLAELMLQKTHNRVVPRVWAEFIRRWPTPQRLARARLTTLERVLHPLGLRKRAAWLRDLGKEIVSRGSGILKRFDGLISLRGVGRYCASAVLCQAFGETVPMVDVNAARVYCRLYGAQMRTARQALLFAEQAATETIRHGSARRINLGLLDFAQAICAANPKCPTCPLLDSCVYGSLHLKEPSAVNPQPW